MTFFFLSEFVDISLVLDSGRLRGIFGIRLEVGCPEALPTLEKRVNDIK